MWTNMEGNEARLLVHMVLGPVPTSIHVIVVVAEEHFKGKNRQLVHRIPLLSPVAKFHLIITFACLCCY